MMAWLTSWKIISDNYLTVFTESSEVSGAVGQKIRRPFYRNTEISIASSYADFRMSPFKVVTQFGSIAI